MVRRKKTTIFLDAKEYTTVNELKKMVEGITKVPPEDQILYKDDQVMQPDRVLGDYVLNCSTAKAQAPAQVGLAYKNADTGRFEVLEITPLSSPPELPDVMKPSDTHTQEQTIA